MSALMLVLLGTTALTAPPGQFFYTRATNGSVTTVVPSGIFEVSLVCIGEGGDASIVNSVTTVGAGGQTAYNTIAVTPGEVLTYQRTSTDWRISVTRGGVQTLACIARHAIGHQAGSGGVSLTGLLATMVRFDGGEGINIADATYRAIGASAGSYGNKGQNARSSSSTSAKGGQGNTPFGGPTNVLLLAGGSPTSSGEDYGGGGAVAGSTSYQAYQGGDGCARAIWGSVGGVPRRYPNTFTGDV